jgi:nicotinamidase-related amidase
MKKRALLIIDVQNDFTGEKARMPVDKGQANTMITNLNRLTDALDPAETEVIYIGNEYEKWDLLNVFRNFAALKGSEGAKLDQRLRKIGQAYFSKKRGNAFSNPELGAYLRKLGASDLFISGLKAEFCVYATVKAALKRHYKTTVLTDCIATTSEKKRQALIGKYRKLGANTLKSDQVIDHVAFGAG